MNITAVAQPDGSVNLIGKQGGTWRFQIQVKQSNDIPMDLTGWNARGQIRKTYSSTTIIKSFNCSIIDPPTDGKIQVELSAADTAQIPCGKSYKDSLSAYVYDIEVFTGAPEEVIRVLQGKLFVDPEVTK